MTRLIRKHQKKLLAILCVPLMVIFAATGLSRNSNSGRNERPMAYVGDTPIYYENQQAADQNWQLLSQMKTRLTEYEFAGGAMSQQDESLMRPYLVPFIYRLGIDIITEEKAHSDVYFLLTLEAQRQGIEISQAEVNTVIINAMRTPDDKQVTPDEMGADGYNRLEAATAQYLKVQTLCDRAASNVKWTQPMWQHELSDHQRARLTVVEFSGSDYAKQVPAPTTQQTREQFDEFSHLTPSESSRKPGSLGYGYEYPDRVKVQYLTVPRKAVIEAARATRKPYDWEVDERMYYYAHQTDFVRAPKPATQPTTMPAAVAPSTAPSSSSLSLGPDSAPSPAPAVAPDPASTQPSTRPFAEVQTEVADKVVQKPADDLQQQIQEAIAARLQADYVKGHRSAGAGASTQPADPAATEPAGESTAEPTTQRTAQATTAPASIAAVSPTTRPSTGPTTAPTFASKEYLDSVALDIQKQFGVLPVVEQAGDWKTSTGLSSLPGIGAARTADAATGGSAAVDFAQYALSDTAPGAESAAKSSSPPLAIDEPSTPLKDFAGNTYFFRITARQPAHPPALYEVLDQVKSDYTASRGYDLAKDAAKQLMQSAEKSTLVAAAGAAGKTAKTTAPFAPGRQPVGDIGIDFLSQMELGQKTIELLSSASPANPHPLTVVPLPREKKVLVVQLAEVQAVLPSDKMYIYELYQSRLGLSAATRHALTNYFTRDAIIARIGYRPEEIPKKPAS